MSRAGDERAPACGGGLTVYYDGSCPLCRAEIGHYRRADRDGAITFEDVSPGEARPASDLDRETAMARFHVRTPDGRLLSGAAAFAALWRNLPGPWPVLGRVAGWPPVTAVLEVGYRLLLPVRPALSRLVGRWQARRQGRQR
ncbi:thiol-disulfide oxidoreductase DCC family protein [Alsobacter sp. R-9]